MIMVFLLGWRFCRRPSFRWPPDDNHPRTVLFRAFLLGPMVEETA